MIRKVVYAFLATIVIGGVVIGTDLMSYVRTSLGYVNSAVKDLVPVEFEIERARRMIDDLVPEIRKHMEFIAREEVELDRLERQINQAKESLDKQRDEILRLKTDLQTGQTTFTYAGRTYTAEQVRTDLARRFERFKTAEATLANLEQIRDARVNRLTAARDKLEGMLAARRQLQLEVEHLQARVQMIAAAQTKSDYNMDQSKLARVKELVADLRSRLDVAARLVEAQVQLQDQIPLDEQPPADIVEQVDKYFAGSGSPAVEVASTH